MDSREATKYLAKKGWTVTDARIAALERGLVLEDLDCNVWSDGGPCATCICHALHTQGDAHGAHVVGSTEQAPAAPAEHLADGTPAMRYADGTLLAQECAKCGARLSFSWRAKDLMGDSPLEPFCEKCEAPWRFEASEETERVEEDAAGVSPRVRSGKRRRKTS